MLLTDLLSKGGVVMGVLLLLSVYVVAVVFYKLWQFWQEGAGRTAFLPQIVELVQDKKLTEAMQIAENEHSPVARMLEVQIPALSDKKITPEQMEKQVASEAVRQLRPFESHLRGLELVATIAPLLGLLGTIIGMIAAFSKIQEVGARIDPSMLAGGIWEALLTTVAGLSVAVPALVIYYFVDGRIEKLRLLMQDTAESLAMVYAAPKAKKKA